MRKNPYAQTMSPTEFKSIEETDNYSGWHSKYESVPTKIAHQINPLRLFTPVPQHNSAGSVLLSYDQCGNNITKALVSTYQPTQ